MQRIFRHLIIFLLLGVAVLGVIYGLHGGKKAPKSILYSEFVQYVEDGKVSEVSIQGTKILGKFAKDEKGYAQFYTHFRREMEPSPEEFLARQHVRFQVADTEGNKWIIENLYLVPLLIVSGLLFMIIRQAQSSGGQAFSFGRSKHKLVSENRVKVTFDDVAGVTEAKEELAEVVDYLKYPKKYQSLGARIPRGVLLLGSPGTGKTLLGRAIAGEAGVPFYYISGSDFVEMFVGVGASRVRDLFEQAKRTSPCVVFIDEIDAVGRQRGAGVGGGHDEREQTLNQLLVEMDGFEPNQNVIILAATNRPDVLDPALLRPGRFDRQVVVDKPDIAGRLAILKVHSRGKPLGVNVDLNLLARQTPGFSGADLENLLNEAALLAARSNRDKIYMNDCEEAIDRVRMGPERKSRIIPEDEREVTAYHEAGHAMVGRSIPESDPVRKVTILPRGMAMGVTIFVPEEDRYSASTEDLLAQISVFMAGRAAEELAFGRITTGASNDIERATQIARDMVCRYGMSKKVGQVHFGRKQSQVFLGRDMHDQRNYSEAVAEAIDEEVRQIVETQYQRAKGILEKQRDLLDTLAGELLRAEVLEDEDLEKILGPSAQSKARPNAEKNKSVALTIAPTEDEVSRSI
ncbi:ATP-dependent zinc metalloprotease FtsH [bacterium]|nr:ATP-dependent zinc metalloprotease FtsH [bacterium]